MSEVEITMKISNDIRFFKEEEEKQRSTRRLMFAGSLKVNID